MSAVMESLARRYDAIKPHLTERQRRLWLGTKARELGSGGVRIVADAVSVSPDTSGGDAPSWMIRPHPHPGGREVTVVGANAPRNGIPSSPRPWTSWSTPTRAGIP
jgi:hypothetical protein